MIASSDLAAWVRDGETETVEFKRTTGELRNGVQTVCGMLNHLGGVVLFGVEAAGKIRGQMAPDEMLEEVARELREIDPPVYPVVEKLPVAEHLYVIAIVVRIGMNRLYSVRGQAYRRMGATTQKLAREEYHRMLLERVHGEVRWENEEARDWRLEELHQAEIFRTYHEAIRNGRLTDPSAHGVEEILRGFGVLKQGRLLKAAVVLFGQSPLIE